MRKIVSQAMAIFGDHTPTKVGGPGLEFDELDDSSESGASSSESDDGV